MVRAPERSNVHGGVQAGSAPATLTEASPTEQGAVDTAVVIPGEQVSGAVARGTPPLRGQRYTRTDVLASHPATTSELEARGG